MGKIGAFDEEAVLHAPARVTEEVHPLSVDTRHCLAARNVRKWRVAAVKAAGGDRKVERIESDRRYRDRAAARDLGNGRRRAELDDLGSTHGRIVLRP
jgi:hypothetical protein